jgi:hypothetical protein
MKDKKEEKEKSQQQPIIKPQDLIGRKVWYKDYMMEDSLAEVVYMEPFDAPYYTPNPDEGDVYYLYLKELEYEGDYRGYNQPKEKVLSDGKVIRYDAMCISTDAWLTD